MQLHDFRNFHNVEINDNGWFCCCDTGSCRQSQNQLFELDCNPYCDTYFEVRMLKCQDSDPCPVIMLTEDFNNADTITSTDYEFNFFMSSFPSAQV